MSITQQSNQKSPKTNKKPNKKSNRKKHGGFFEKYPNVSVYRYWIPKQYKPAVDLIIEILQPTTSFNKAVDQAADTFPNLDRNKLAEHTLKYIANDY